MNEKLEYGLFLAKEAEKWQKFYCETTCRRRNRCARNNLVCFLSLLTFVRELWTGEEDIISGGQK